MSRVVLAAKEENMRQLEGIELDLLNQIEIDAAQRMYRKCISGKCPQMRDHRTSRIMATEKKMSHSQYPRLTMRSKKPDNVLSKSLQDKKIKVVWKDQGRNHRFEILNEELEELNTKINVASGHPHLKEHERHFELIEGLIKKHEKMDDQVKKTKLQITHLKSQFDRLNRKETELSRQTESEGIESKSRQILRSIISYVFFSFFLQMNIKFICGVPIDNWRFTRDAFRQPANVNVR